jgi:adenine phosphoribosyltransferase
MTLLPQVSNVSFSYSSNCVGGSAAAAGSLVNQLGGSLLGYVFIMELDFLKGRDKLDAPVFTLFGGQEKALAES